MYSSQGRTLMVEGSAFRVDRRNPLLVEVVRFQWYACATPPRVPHNSLPTLTGRLVWKPSDSQVSFGVFACGRGDRDGLLAISLAWSFWGR